VYTGTLRAEVLALVAVFRLTRGGLMSAPVVVVLTKAFVMSGTFLPTVFGSHRYTRANLVVAFTAALLLWQIELELEAHLRVFPDLA
jgi:hypothetical protein